MLLLISNRARIFIEAVRAMTTSGTAAIAALEMILFGENFPAFGREIKIFAFDEFIFRILFIHKASR